MPLDKSGSKESVGKNIKTEMAAGKPQRQAIAIALDVARRAKRAAGGKLQVNPPRMSSRSMFHSGPVMSAVPGRTDRHNMKVAAGSYVLPSAHVSSLGQDNTMAGMKVLNGMFSGPYGGKSQPIRRGKGIGRMRADGGGVDEGVDVVVAGGEYILTPEQVAEVGGGDLDRGHEVLDNWVMSQRAEHIKTLRNLPGPAKD